MGSTSRCRPGRSSASSGVRPRRSVASCKRRDPAPDRVRRGGQGVPGSYSGELNAGGTELTGTFTQRGVSIPLTFTRDAR